MGEANCCVHCNHLRAFREQANFVNSKIENATFRHFGYLTLQMGQNDIINDKQTYRDVFTAMDGNADSSEEDEEGQEWCA